MEGGCSDFSLYPQNSANPASTIRQQQMRFLNTQREPLTSHTSLQRISNTFCPSPLSALKLTYLQSGDACTRALSLYAIRSSMTTSATTPTTTYSMNSLTKLTKMCLIFQFILNGFEGLRIQDTKRGPFLQLLPISPDVPHPFDNKIIMFSLNSVLQNLRPSALVSNIATNYSRLKERISPPLAITELLPGLYHLDFPQQQHSAQLAQHTAGAAFLLFNIGEYPYQDELAKQLLQRNPKGELHHLNFQLYGTLPFCELISAIAQISQAIAKGGKVYVHCQEGRVRSAVFLASYLFVTAGMDISEAILQVNKRLAINLQSSNVVYKNQHALFKNLVNYQTDKNFINKQRLQLQRIAISNAPKINPNRTHNQPTELIEVQVVLEIRCGPEVVHKCVYKNSVSEGDSVCLQVGKSGKSVIVGDEFLVIIKYLHKNMLYNVMRIQANTNFIFNSFARVHQHDIDLSGYCLPNKANTFIDLAFTPHTSTSRLAQLTNPQPPIEQKKETWDLLSGEGVTDSQLDVQEDQFDWLQEEPDIDQHELNSKIEEVMKNMSRKEEERDCDRSSEEEEDFDDYLGKLESQAQT